MPICTTCKREDVKFSKNKTRSNGYNNECQVCHKGRLREYRMKPMGRAHSLNSAMRSRCKKKGLECTISVDYIAKKIAGGVCEVTGIPFDLSTDGTRVNNRSFCPSVDRIDPSLGYTEDNVQIVVWIYNRAKGVCGHGDVMKLVEALSNGS